MRRGDRLQRFLYLIMLILGTYILYKAGNLLLDSWIMQKALESGSIQRSLEDAAAKTYAPGYTAAIDGYDGDDWMAVWMEQVAPVYSYVAEGQAGEREESEDISEAKTGADSEDTASDAADETKEDGTVGAEEAGGADAVMTDGTEAAGAEEAGGADTVMIGETEAGGTVIGENAEEGKAGTADTGASQGGVPETEENQDNAAEPASGSMVSADLLEQLSDFNYLVGSYYIVDSNTAADEELLDASVLLAENLSIKQDPAVPQILIYHTHSQEAFIDSEEGVVSDTIVGAGEALAELLRTEYGYNVIHDTGVYDLVNGVLDRSAAYEYARTSVELILEEYPTIEVVIDLHRDGVDGEKFVTEIDGRKTAMIMLFNGISRNSEDEPVYWLENPYVTQNLAFSLQLELKARDQYPGYTRNIYLNSGRYNLDLRPRSLLVEAGTQLNTVEEEKNAMIPLAELLHQVLSGE